MAKLSYSERFTNVKKYDEAIYGTIRGLPGGFFFGNSSLSKDRKNIYQK